jgi:hypothetical protein
MNLNGEDKNGKSFNNDDSKLQLFDPGYLSENSVKIELLKNKKLIHFYEECEYHNELLGYLNSNIHLLLRRTKAIKSKEDKLLYFRISNTILKFQKTFIFSDENILHNKVRIVRKV